MDTSRHVCCILFGDIRFDSRSSKFLQTLTSAGYRTTAIMVPDVSDAPYPPGINIHLIRISGSLPTKLRFLFFYCTALAVAVRTRATTFLASELYSLPAAWCASVFTGATLVYDSRELYSAIAALHKRPFTQRFWTLCERVCARRAVSIVTVNPSLAKFLRETFTRHTIHIVRNIPFHQDITDRTRLRKHLNISDEKKIVLYQGGLQNGRGIGIALSLAQHFPDTEFVFLGSGPLRQTIEESSRRFPTIRLIEAVPMQELITYTAGADLGWCVIENFGLSYYYSLPNKLFEYIMAGIPVIGSAFPEIQNIIDTHHIGITIDPENISALAESLRQMLTDKNAIAHYRENCRRASESLTWQNETGSLLKAFSLE
jgi:glycosyltransferase involved in cell wall biosynthesis